MNLQTLAHRMFAWTLLLSIAGGFAEGASEPLAPHLKEYYEIWLRKTTHLLTDAEKGVFVSLKSPGEREVFIQQFWKSRQTSGKSNPLDRWNRNLRDAQQIFPDRWHERARAVLIAGKPSTVTTYESCAAGVRPLEVWEYDAWRARTQSDGRMDKGFRLLFMARDPLNRNTLRPWSAAEGLDALLIGQAEHEWTVESWLDFGRRHDCWQRPSESVDRLRVALQEALDLESLSEQLMPAPDASWLATFTADQKAAHADLATAKIDIEYPGRYQQKTILLGRLAVPAERVRRNAEGQLFDRLEILGDIYRGARLIDAFRVVYHVAGNTPGPTLPLEFYRRMRPGTYRLELRLSGLDGLALLRHSIPLEVPSRETAAEPPAGRRLGFAGLTRREVGLLNTLPSLEVLVPEAGPLAGVIEIEAATTGGPIERVEFQLDGKTLGSDSEPPWSWPIDFGETPIAHQVSATALDAEGRALAAHTLDLSGGVDRLGVQILEPRRSGPLDHVRLALQVPEDEALDRIELFLNEDRFAVLKKAPFVHPLRLKREDLLEMTWIRALAVLESGETAEALSMIYSPNPLSQVDVDLVELFVSVTDRKSRPVSDLPAEAFRVLEEGQPQEILRFERIHSLPIHVALLMDVSGSMRGRVRTAAAGAERFFTTVLTEKDRAAFLTFNHDIHLQNDFSADAERLRYSAQGARAWGTTRLYDSLIYTIHAFAGLPGRRALVLLSDGRDVDSDFTFKQVLENTLRSRLTVYPIALELPDEKTRTELERLAADSGGRFFAISSTSQLASIYQQIEEDLRSQYLLVYRPKNSSTRTKFRQTQVELSTVDQLIARTSSGYFP